MSEMNGNPGLSGSNHKGGPRGARVRGEGMRLVSRILWSSIYAVTLVPIAFGNGVALAADIYVDAVAGSDAVGNGTAGNPYQTIGFGIASAVSGDVVHAQPGDYNQALESFPLSMKPGVSVVADGGTLQTYISTDSSDTLVEFVGYDFDAATKLSGFTLRGTTGTAQSGATGVYIDGSTAGVTSVAPVIRDNVLNGLEFGVYMNSTNATDATDVSPIITNNVMESIYTTGVFGYAAQADTMAPVITQNLIDSYYGNDQFSYGIALNAMGGDGDDVTGAKVVADIESNVILRNYYNIYLYAYSGVAPPAPKLKDGASGEVSGTLSSDVIAATVGGAIEAYVVNNRLGTADNTYTRALQAIADGGDDVGGQIELTVKNNDMLSSYGVYVATFNDSATSYGPAINGMVANNLIDATYYDDTFSIGVYANAESAGSSVDLSVMNNTITTGYGVLAFASGSAYGTGPGGEATVHVHDNTIDGTQFYTYTYGIYGFAFGGHGDVIAGDVVSPGSVDLHGNGNVITATYGIYLGAWESFTTGGDTGVGGDVSGNFDRNIITSLNQYQNGFGVWTYARDASNQDATHSGGSVDLTLTNNVIRGYEGIHMEVSSDNSTAEDGGKGTASIVNNTIVGGAHAFGYDEGFGIYSFGGTSLTPFNPVVDNNIIITTPATTNAPVRFGDSADAFSDPMSLDNNDLLARRGGGPVANLHDVSFYSTGVVNTFAFADANVSVEPNFSCENQGNVRLLATSPLIDSGKPNGLGWDFESDARPIGAGIDIGADEYNGTRLGTTFQDVGPESPYYLYVEALAAAGVTGGCLASPPLYCPSQVVSREQMAIFIVRALGAAPNSTGAPVFADVPSTRFSFPYVQTFSTLGITGGCSAGLYCPLAPVTRGQMAVFLVRALGEAPDASLPAIFADVTPLHPYYGYIQTLSKLGVTGGCSTGNYCPEAPVTREQMAAFIIRAFDLPVPLACTGRVADKHGVQPGVIPEGMAVAPAAPVESARAAEVGTVMLAASGMGEQASVIERSPVEARGASGGIGPAGNSYLKLTAAQRAKLTAKRAASTPKRNQIKGRSAVANMSRDQFQAAVQAKVDAFVADWQAKGRSRDQLNVRRVKALAARSLRYPSASKPVDTDRWVMTGEARHKIHGKARKSRGRVKNEARQLPDVGIASPTSVPNARNRSGGND